MRMNRHRSLPGQQGNVISNQFGNDSLRDTLDDDDLFRRCIRKASSIGTLIPRREEALTLEDTSGRQDGLQGTKTEVVVGLRRELLVAQVEERHDLRCKGLRCPKTLREKHDLRDKLAVGARHGHGTEQLGQVRRELRTTGVVWIGRDEDTHVLIELDVLADELDLRVRVLSERSETLLDTLDLLGDGTENAFLKTIELVETSPRAHLTETDEDTTHGLQVKCLVATEDKDEATQLYTKSLYGLRLA